MRGRGVPEVPFFWPGARLCRLAVTSAEEAPGPKLPEEATAQSVLESTEASAEGTRQPSGFLVPLQGYQLKSLRWMLGGEGLR